MNMKKTMAAIAAGAVAVSAMATTVSAVEDQTLNYDLTAATEVWTKGTCNLVANFSGIDLSGATAGGETRFGITGLEGVSKMVVTIKDTTGGAGSKVFTFDWNEGINENAWQINSGFAPIANEAFAGIDKGDITITATVNHNVGMDGTWAAAGTISEFNACTGFIDIDFDWTDDATTAGVYITGVTQPSKTYLQSPMETTLNNNYNVITYLAGAYNSAMGDMYLNGDTNNYVNVGPVLNDAIENYETTTFVFNSAKERVRFEAVVGGALTGLKAATKDGVVAKVNGKIATLNNEKGKLDQKLDDALAAYEESIGEAYNASTADPEADETIAVVTAQKDVDAKVAEIAKWADAKMFWYYTTETGDSTDYSKFTQHLYNGMVSDNYFAKENTNYLGLDWAGYNLFQGGLVINEGWTMSLADTTMFDWGESTVSFNWDAIADAAQTSNAYALYLHSMELATSVDWYWDSLDVVLTAGAVDDATSDAEAKADDETLEEEVIEEEVEEEIVEEEIVEEEVEEEVEEVVEEEVEEEVEVSNPTTGNASVALAVIPVALAAAAVVAKKRN